MDKDQVSISFECTRCGTKLSWQDDTVDSDVISCSKCGMQAGTFGELKSAGIDALAKKVEKDIANIFKRR